VKRREFITLLGSAAAAWPLAARAQLRERARRIGVLVALGADDSQAQARNAAFLQGLGELGWIVGRNLQIDFRWGGGNARRYRRQAAELVAFAPEVIVAMGSSVVGPLLQTTRTVPIVFLQVTRSGQLRLRREPGAAGRKRYRICPVRICHQCEVDRTSQRDRPTCDAGGRPSGSHGTRWSRSIRRNPVSGAFVEGRDKPARRPRRARHRARYHCVCAGVEQRPDSAAERADRDKSHTDHHPGGLIQAAFGLSLPLLRRRWRPDLLRAQ